MQSNTALHTANQISLGSAANHNSDQKPCPDFPRLSRPWLGIWKKQYGISLRKPTQKYKVSKDKVVKRSRRTWLNCYIVRAIFAHFLGTERSRKGLLNEPFIHCVDQMGLMYNQQESMGAPTLAFRGEQNIPLKTNHGQSRQRLSINTHLSDDIGYPPPVELLFKLSTNRKTKDLGLPPGMRVSVNWGEKGSYNYPAFMRYLEKWLLPWTEERQQENDWRILLLDSFAVHKMPEVFAFAKSRGYIILIMGGGTTPILCILDTDLHSRLKGKLIALEGDDLHQQAMLQPYRVPSRGRQTLVDDTCSCWAGLPLSDIGRRSLKRVGMSIALPRKRRKRANDTWSVSTNAPEDHEVTREAAMIWDDAGMRKCRKEALETVYNKIEAGTLSSWDQVADELLPMSSGDEQIEGEEVDDASPVSEFDVSSDGDDDGGDHGGGAGKAVHKQVTSKGGAGVAVPKEETSHAAEPDGAATGGGAASGGASASKSIAGGSTPKGGKAVTSCTHKPTAGGSIPKDEDAVASSAVEPAASSSAVVVALSAIEALPFAIMFSMCVLLQWMCVLLQCRRAKTRACLQTAMTFRVSLLGGGRQASRRSYTRYMSFSANARLRQLLPKARSLLHVSTVCL
jgi:hypothetical protein